MNSSKGDNAQSESTIHINPRQLPVLYDVDVAVVGGSFSGVSAACELAKAGKTVALIESRTYLGREITATLRPWLNINQEDSESYLTDVVQSVSSHSVKRQDETALYMDHVKIALEDALLEKGVKLLYASLPVELYDDKAGKKLLVVGNKSGRQIIRSRVIIDATDSASVLRLAGEEFESISPLEKHYKKTIEIYRTVGLSETVLEVPRELGIEGNRVYVHQGYLEKGHIFLEFILTLNDDQELQELDQTMKDEILSRHKMIQLTEYFMKNHPAFKNAYLAASSYELQPLEMPRLKAKPAHASLEMLNELVHVTAYHQGSLINFASSDCRLWCLNESADLDQAISLFSHPDTSSRLGEQVARKLAERWTELLKLIEGESAHRIEKDQAKTKLRNHWEFKELEQPQEGKNYPRELVPEKEIPIIHHVDVLVVGGGTSGATAAITSAKEGMRTLLLEMNPGLGGTATLGAVDSYWFGRRVGFNQKVTEKVNEIEHRINHFSPKWNIEAKMYALLNEAEKAGVKTYFRTVTIGTIMEGNRVRGVVFTSNWGTFAVIAETVIDATGDGDIAAFAGADYLYGSEKDHIVMWYSLAQFAKPGRSQNNFTSMVHISNIEDYTRAILEGRRRKRNRDVHDHGIYVASRETRHILGRKVLTLTDQLRHRQWQDVVNLHFSNHDMKGKNGADWMHLGLIPPNLEIEIPYQILLPKGLEGLLIAGKAISATHDAFAAIRMQSDLENLGGVVALAAAQAIRNHQLPSEIDVRELQQRLMKEGILPEDVVSRTLENKIYKDEELEALVSSLTGEEPLYMYADMEMDEVFTDKIPIVEVCTVGPRIIPFLERALDQALETTDIKRQVILAQALAMYDSNYGASVLIREIEKELSVKELPIRDNSIRNTQLPPDQGAMPDVVYLIYTLGMTRDKRSLSIWQEVAAKLDPSERNLKDMLKGTFYYVDAVCYGMERLADPDGIPILKKLHSHVNLKSQVRTFGIEPDYFRERQAMLELAIARALARCGSKEGYRLLIQYLNDTRSLLAEQAHTELKRLTGLDFHKNSRDWTFHIDSRETIEPRPLTLKLDMPTY